jgi:putative PEP-CTERM system histidine kinase
MIFSTILSFVAALFSSILGLLVFLRDRHSFVHRIYFAGMIVLAIEATLTGLTYHITSPEEAMFWYRVKMISAAFLPGIWILFSLSFARGDNKGLLYKWKGLVLIAFVIPLALTTLFNSSLFAGVALLGTSSPWVLRLGWSGYAFYVFFLLSTVFILMNMERVFRGAIGHLRWQIKFMVLGLGSLFAIRIYTATEALLLRSLDPGFDIFNVGGLIVAGVLMIRSLPRMKLLNLDVYLSYSLLYNSFTILMVGIYLLAVGIFSRLIAYFSGGQSFHFRIFFLFLACVALAILLVSDRIRSKMRHFIVLNFRRSRYDYRKEWEFFTKRITPLTEVNDLCSTVAKMVAETVDVLSVTIWLLDETGEQLLPCGSTALSVRNTEDLELPPRAAREIIRHMRDEEMPVNLADAKLAWASDLKKSEPDYTGKKRIQWAFPLNAGGELLGLMSVGERVSDIPFSAEDLDLLKTISVQLAGSLLNLKLVEQVRQAKEKEAFQTVSAFMIHDLKNLASKLSLTMENFPGHFDNPEFRKDALNVISQSVKKINSMCSNLSILSQKIELNRAEIDLNQLVRSTLSGLNGYLDVPLIQKLHPLPKLLIDSEQMQKVLTNLILNANEAMTNGGEIQVATEQRDRWIVLMVKDNGCGMSREFVERSLFRPFQTTKKQGMGIGLFHTKTIVEAHGGRIEVESEEGKGTTFRVFLPIAANPIA